MLMLEEIKMSGNIVKIRSGNKGGPVAVKRTGDGQNAGEHLRSVPPRRHGQDELL